MKGKLADIISVSFSDGHKILTRVSVVQQEAQMTSYCLKYSSGLSCTVPVSAETVTLGLSDWRAETAWWARWEERGIG